MTTSRRRITVGGVPVEIDRKAVKTLLIGVYPPDGRVRVSAPLALSDDAVRLAVVGRLSWVRRQRAGYTAQLRQSERQMVSGESHYVLGRRYRLRVVTHDGPAVVTIRGKGTLELRARAAVTSDARRAVLARWYRGRLRELVPSLLAKWEVTLGVSVTAWAVRRMKTRWGTCDPTARRVWFNTELATKPPRCLEYVVVHELAHLLARRHDGRFTGLLDRHLPDWRQARAELNALPLGYDEWGAEASAVV